MHRCQAGNFLFTLVILCTLFACVPVEEKTEVPFDISLQNDAVRRVYGMQISQNKDSLLLYLQSDDASIRYAVARAFASYHDSTALDALLPLLMDQNGKVRAMAAEAIGLLGSRK